MSIAKWTAEVRARLACLNWRSDDFGHDTQALLVAESAALQTIGDDLENALAVIEILRDALKWYANCDEERTSEYAIAGLDKCAVAALAKADEVMK